MKNEIIKCVKREIGKVYIYTYKWVKEALKFYLSRVPSMYMAVNTLRENRIRQRPELQNHKPLTEYFWKTVNSFVIKNITFL